MNVVRIYSQMVKISFKSQLGIAQTLKLLFCMFFQSWHEATYSCLNEQAYNQGLPGIRRTIPPGNFKVPLGMIKFNVQTPNLFWGWKWRLKKDQNYLLSSRLSSPSAILKLLPILFSPESTVPIRAYTESLDNSVNKSQNKIWSNMRLTQKWTKINLW